MDKTGTNVVSQDKKIWNMQGRGWKDKGGTQEKNDTN